MTNFPGGVSSFGLPVLPSNVPATSGSVFFVDSVTGSNGNSGKDTTHPFATIAYAITRCTASKGDTVVCMPNHTEAVVGAGTITASKAGIRIVGLGYARQRPVITYTTAAAASVDVTAAGVLIQNVVFQAVGVDAVTAMVNVSAAGVTFRYCEFETGDATNQAVLGMLTTAAASRLVVDSCHFHGSADAGTATAIRIVGGDAIQIVNNVIWGNYTTSLGGIDNPTTAATGLIIQNNVIVNQTASSTKAIVLKSDSTGIVVDNRLVILSGSAPITAAAGYVSHNYYAAAAGVTASALI